MKKFLWVAAVLALALIVFGCGGGKHDDDDDYFTDSEAFWLSPDDTGLVKLPDNRKELIGDDSNTAYVHVFFNPYVPYADDTFPLSATQFQQFCVEIDFEIEGDDGLGFMWQCCYDPYGTWARSSEDRDYIDMLYPGEIHTITCRVHYIFPAGKGNWNTDLAAQYPSRNVVELASLKGICLQIPDVEEGRSGGTFVLKDVRFMRYDLSGNPVLPPLRGPSAPKEE